MRSSVGEHRTDTNQPCQKGQSRARLSVLVEAYGEIRLQGLITGSIMERRLLETKYASRCPSCGNQNKQGTAYCVRCGASLPFRFKCHSCGTWQEAGPAIPTEGPFSSAATAGERAFYCTYCGINMADSSASSRETKTFRKEERLKARRARDSERKGIPAVAGIAIVLVALVLSQIAAVRCMGFGFGTALISGLASEHGGSAWVFGLAALYFSGFLLVVVIPALLGFLGQKWGFALGLSYCLLFVFVVMPYFWFGEHLSKYRLSVPLVSTTGLIVAAAIAMAASGLTGFLSYLRHRKRSTKPLLLVKRLEVSVFFGLTLCVLAAFVAPSAIPYLKGHRTKTFSIPEYGFSITQLSEWYGSRKPGVDYENPLRREAVAEYSLSSREDHGEGVTIFVYDSMPFTALPFDSFSSKKDIYVELRRTFEERKQFGGDKVSFRWEGETQIGGEEGVRLYYGEVLGEGERRDKAPDDGDMEYWVYNSPYLYSLGFRVVGDDCDKVVDSFKLISISDKDEETAEKEQVEPPYPGRRDYTWVKTFNGQGLELNDASALDPSHVWATGAEGVYYFDGEKWAMQLPHGEDDKTAGVKALDPNHVWAFGHGSIHFFDGSAWVKQADDILYWNEGPNAMDASAPDSAWAVGGDEGGKVLFFNGTEWIGHTEIQEGLMSIYALWGVAAPDPQHVWAAGGSGIIYFFDGASWIRQYHATQERGSEERGVPFNELCAADDSHVWALSRNMVYYFDGGDWKKRFEARGLNHQFNQCSPVDASRAWITGEDEIFLFEDGDCAKQFDIVGNVVGVLSLDADSVLIVADDGALYSGRKK